MQLTQIVLEARISSPRIGMKIFGSDIDAGQAFAVIDRQVEFYFHLQLIFFHFTMYR